MPSPITDLIHELGLRSSCAVMPISGMGCRGGAHAITLGSTWLRANPQHRVLVVTADFASPHFHIERDLDDTALVGSIVSSTLFSDAAAAAVMSCDLTEGIEVLDTISYQVPGTTDSITWAVADEGLRFRLTTDAVRSIPALGLPLQTLLAGQDWTGTDLSICALHSGGNNIIRDAQKTLGLTADQVEPAWASLKRGNLMSSAVLDAISLTASRPDLRPSRGAPILGAGFGPGFGMDAFVGRAMFPAISAVDQIGRSGRQSVAAGSTGTSGL